MRHLNKCQPFYRYMMKFDVSGRPKWFTTKRPKISSTEPLSNQKLISDYVVPPVDRRTKDKFQEHIALHYYITGTPFQRIEDDNLVQAIIRLRPDSGFLPTRKMLAERLLDKSYEMGKKISTTCLSDKTKYFCLATDGWSNVKNEPIINNIALSPTQSLVKPAPTRYFNVLADLCWGLITIL